MPDPSTVVTKHPGNPIITFRDVPWPCTMAYNPGGVKTLDGKYALAFRADQFTDINEDQIKILGFDALPEALAAVKDGTLAATVEQFPGGQSRMAMQIMVEHVNNGTAPAESLVLLEPIAITADNIDQAERLGELN